MGNRYASYNFLLNRIIEKDNLFCGDYTLDPYQNCEFGCIYCDSSIDDIIYIKSNSVNILKDEIKKINKGLIIIGSVVDPYQKIEKKLKITRNLLKIIENNDFSVHILTKSDLVLRDIDILTKIKNATVTISLISLNESILSIFEKNVPSSEKRLDVIHNLSENGIKTGLALMPMLPFIVEDELEEIVKFAKSNGASYLIYKHLELKGILREIFLKSLNKLNPNLVDDYNKLYGDMYMPDISYIVKIQNLLNKYCKKWNISTILE